MSLYIKSTIIFRGKEKGQQLYTFSIGIPGSPDNKYAQIAADYIGSIHTVVNITTEDAINALKDVIWATETFDITTVRASTGQYLISKYIADNTDFKVVLSGDGSDEVMMTSSWLTCGIESTPIGDKGNITS